MNNDFARTFNRMLAITGKSLNQVSAIGGVDPTYTRKLATGEKTNPSNRTVLRLFLGLVFDPEVVKKDPTMVEGLAELLEAATTTAL